MTGQTPGDGSLRALDLSPGAVYRRRADGDQSVVAVGDGVEALTGYEPADLVGENPGDADRSPAAERSERGWLDLVRSEDGASLRETVANAAPGDYHDETYRIRTADGEQKWVRDRFVVTDGEEGDGGRTSNDGRAPGEMLEGAVVDVTETIERRRDLEADAELLDALFDQIPIHVYVKDREARHVRISDYMDFPEDVIGKRDIDVDFVREESARRAYEDDMRVIEDGETVLDQEQYYPAVDEWDLNSKVPLYDDDGEVIGLLGATRRITERKRAQQELREKTERLEEFADVVSRDIRTALNDALEYAERVDDVEADEQYVERAGEALERAERVVDDVLALSREDALDVDRRRVSLPAVAREAWQTVETGDASLALPDEDVVLDADRELLARVFETLFRNGAEREADDVTVDVLDGDEPPGSDGETGQTQSGVVVAVEDDGAGIPPEERDRIFEPAHGVGESESGLGLAMVEEIVEAHGWSVDVIGPGDAASDGSDGQDRDGCDAASDSSASVREKDRGAELPDVRFEITGVESRSADD